MDIDSFRIFCDLVELQNFSRTAERHGVSQSAVSQKIAQLETRHKCQLVKRKSRPIKLTEAGQSFYRACQEILDRYERLKSELSSMNKTHGHIQIASIFSIGMYRLQPYVKKFMSAHPDVTLNLSYRSAAEIYDGLLSGEIDMGIVALPKRDRNFVVHDLDSEPLVWVCSPASNLSNLTSIDIHQLDGMKFIAFAEGLPTRKLIDSVFEKYNVMPQTVMEFDNTETIKRAVEIDAGVAILPESTIAAEIAGGTLSALSITNENISRPTGLVVRKNRSLSIAGRYLIELLSKKPVE